MQSSKGAGVDAEVDAGADAEVDAGVLDRGSILSVADDKNNSCCTG